MPLVADVVALADMAKPTRQQEVGRRLLVAPSASAGRSVNDSYESESPYLLLLLIALGR